MSEATVVNLFLTARVLLVGGILVVLPRITRKGLVFGAYVGEATVDRKDARRILAGWDRSCVTLMVVSLLVGWAISLAGRPVAGNLTGTAILVLGAAMLYLRFHHRARDLVPAAAARQAEQATAPLLGSDARGTGLAVFALGFCLVTALATLAYAIVSYPAVRGESFALIVLAPGVNLLLSPFLALLALLTVRAKRSVWTALLFCAFMALLSVEIVRLGLSETRDIGFRIVWMAGIAVAFMLAALIWIMTRYGQGGALRETGTVEAPLTNGLADNARWVWGVFYVDRDDPSIMVEKRFGIGYTLNYGNRTAIRIVVTWLILALGLAALALLGG
jgi:uncharacterized membrane protein